MCTHMNAYHMIGKNIENVFAYESLFFSDPIQFLSIMSSIISLSWAVVSHNKAFTLKKASIKRHGNVLQGTCPKIKYFIRSTVCLFLWRFCTVCSRVIVFALALKVCLHSFNHYVLYSIIITFSTILLVAAPGMLSYIVERNPRRKPMNALWKVISFVIFTLDFVYEILKAGRSKHGKFRQRATTYYCFVFIVTFLTVITWYIMIPIRDDNTFIVLLVFALVLFFMGIAFMMIHYMFCHNSRKDIRKWIPCNEVPAYFTYVKWRIATIFVLTLLILIAAIVVRIFLPW